MAATVINTAVHTDSFKHNRDGIPIRSVAVEKRRNEKFLAAALGNPSRFHYNSGSRLHVASLPVRDYSGPDRTRNGLAYPVNTTSLAVQALHQAFAGHVAFSLRPETAWYMIVHEVAEYIRQNPDECARLFTGDAGAKQTIEVRDDSLSYDRPSDWGRTINLFRNPLHERLAEGTADLFLPRFSTTTVVDETALLVALMDAASPYCRYEVMTLCGIPKIRLEGHYVDWRKLYVQAESLAGKFNGLYDYFANLLPVLQTIANTAEGATPNFEFWRSIYKYNSGSGGPRVNGWIRAFFAFIQTPDGPQPKDDFEWGSRWGGFRLNHFPAHVSNVRFIWDYYGRLIPMTFAAGITSVGYEDSFLTPKLGFAVAEV